MLYFSFFRLLQHTYNDPNSVCRVDTLFEKYVDNCSNNDIPSVSPNSFKQTVSKLWDINSTSTTSGGERAYVYKGLKCVENPQNTPIIEEHLPSGWFVIAKDHSGVRVAIKCDVSVNGTPLLKEVHMDSEYKCDIYISNKCIAPHALGLPDNLATTSISPHTYQKMVQSCRICMGKEVEAHISSCSKWSNDSQNHTTSRRQSPKCHGLLNIVSRADMCRSCLYIGQVNSTPQENNNDELVDNLEQMEDAL